MPALAEALISQHYASQGLQNRISANAIPASWNGQPATLEQLQSQVSDLYLRVNTLPQETIKAQKDIEKKSSLITSLISLACFGFVAIVKSLRY